ncbi:hypothetical protein FH972_022977 [Carpinus fangiana]|uniref:Uncharacterized protein n=1 Tax=Carpinus fangiana TaxID=176857 RepID=A0A5N6KU45_9ROSI|nr:hypothetical protein FH972_022977 [Carpinus fangiana]
MGNQPAGLFDACHGSVPLSLLQEGEADPRHQSLCVGKNIGRPVGMHIFQQIDTIHEDQDSRHAVGASPPSLTTLFPPWHNRTLTQDGGSTHALEAGRSRGACVPSARGGESCRRERCAPRGESGCLSTTTATVWAAAGGGGDGGMQVACMQVAHVQKWYEAKFVNDHSLGTCQQPSC